MHRRHLSGNNLHLIEREFSMTEQSPLMPPADRQLSSYHHHHLDSATENLLKSPPLAVWIVPAMACALAYAL